MTEDRGSLRPLMDSLGGLLSNPVVLEGLIAGISAISASRRTKRSGDGTSPQSMGGILDMLPGILPLLSVFSGSGSDPVPQDAVSVFSDTDPEAPDEAAPALSEAGEDDAPLFGVDDGGNAETAETTETGAFDISYESQASQRENLLLAIRPFLSESRRSAADAMVQVNKLSGLFRQR